MGKREREKEKKKEKARDAAKMAQDAVKLRVSLPRYLLNGIKKKKINNTI